MYEEYLKVLRVRTKADMEDVGGGGVLLPLLDCGLLEFFWETIMTKRYTGPALKPKKHVVPSKYRVPVLKDKAPPPKKGHRYGSAGLRAEK